MNHSISLQAYTIHVLGQLDKVVQLFLFSDHQQVIILVDENTRAYCLPHLLMVLPEPDNVLILEIPAGEEMKNIDTCQGLWQSLMQEEVDRKALMVNLGGGVIGDMGGFVASTFKRGISFVNIPTTLLSQVDATIGGKLGVNFSSIKNSVGLFNDPKAVFIYPGFLRTLPPDELVSGYAEMVKHALISSEEAWKNIQKVDPTNENDWSDLIMASLKIKADIVQADPYEQGFRKSLNFGHTIGHALESYSFSTDKPLLHGQAVALGMIGEAYLSMQCMGLAQSAFEEIVGYIKLLYAPYFDKEADLNNLLELMRNDKKNQGNRVNFTLLSEIGQPHIDQLINEDDILKALEYMKVNL